MAYCLRSFVQILEEVLHPDKHHKKWILDHDKIPQYQSLLEKATFLRDFFDNSSPLLQYTIESLEDQIMDMAGKAEDTLETYLTSQLISYPQGQAFTISPPNLEEAIQAFGDAKQEVIKIMDACQRPDVDLPISSTANYSNHNNMIVGVTEDLNQLRSRLTSRASELDIIPIVGMGGMGKTTLAQILYEQFSSTSKSHFDCSAWVTISQSYDPKLILGALLDSVTRKPISREQTTSELILILYKLLYGRRYLIVLDDIWSSEAWDDVQRAFPRDNKGSRIILTTRENTVVDYVKSKSHEMHLIGEDESWELLRGKVFGEESCPRELEEVGKTIATSCGGLPLALQVIGGLLLQSHKSIDSWEHVAYNVPSLIAKKDVHFSGIFSLSFAHLPHYLKPCFLYMADFEEDEEIPASRIIKMWVSEGFLLPIRDKSLEEAGRIHLNALVDRNLIYVRKRGKSGRPKSFGIHDLLRDLCLRKAQEKKFLYFKDLQTDKLQKDELFLSRIVCAAAFDDYRSILTRLTRSFRSFGRHDGSSLPCLCVKFSLLRVLNLNSNTNYGDFPGEILQLVNLKYLCIFTRGYIPESISVLRNLQTLITDRISCLAMISDMPQLRHLKFDLMEEYSEWFLNGIHENVQSLTKIPAYGVHENLQSLTKIPAKEIRKLFGKLPNLRKLSIEFGIDVESLNTEVGFDVEEFIDLTSFHNLETLSCRSGFSFSSTMTFPVSLKKLSWEFSKIDKSLLDAIGALPNLMILKFSDSYREMDWAPTEGGFCALQYLEICQWNLVNWVATEFHFPVLEHLVLKRCDSLIEIPNDFAGIETLKIIEVDYCLPSVFDSATRILEEQCHVGSTGLQLQLGTHLVEVNKQRYGNSK